MHLIRLGKSRWEVVALCDQRGSCPVLDFLGGLDKSLRSLCNRMLGLLREYVTYHGPPRSIERCRHLEDGIWEFKTGQLRVLWFYDQDRVIVCTHGFMKKTRKTPRREIRQAKELRERYLFAVRSSRLRLLDA
jgi:phage-related protein